MCYRSDIYVGQITEFSCQRWHFPFVLPPAQGAMEPVEVLVTPTPMKGHLETETPRSTTSSEQELADIVHSPVSTQVTSPMEMQRGC